MKKFLSALVAVMLLVSLTASAFAAAGLGSHTTVKVTPTTADAAGSVSVDTVMCAVEVDEAGKILDVMFDMVQSKGTTDAEATVEPQSKRELGDAYGMKVASSIGKEYYEQLDALEAWCTGKTLAEVLAGAFEDADLKAGCTFYIGGELKALEEAVANAK